MKWLYLQTKKHHVAFLLLIGGVLRLYDFTDRDIWFDEAFTGILVRESWGRMMEIIIADTHPPLYYFLLKPIAAVFDYSPYGLRVLSFVWGIATLYLLYRVSKELFSERVAMYATVIGALSPFAIYYSGEARSYSMLAGLILLGCYCFILALRTKRLGWYLGWGVAIGLACLTHYMALICSPLFFIIWGVHHIESQIRLRDVRGIMSGYVIQIILFLPWLPFFLRQFRNREHLIGWIEPATLSYALETLTIFLFGSPEGDLGMGMQVTNTIRFLPNQFVHTMVFALFMSAIVVVWCKEKKYRYLLFVLSVVYMGIVYGIKYIDAYYFLPRYLIVVAYIVYIIFAVALSQMKKNSARFMLMGYIVCLFFITPLDPSVGYGNLAKEKKYISEHTFYMLNSYDYVIAKYYFGYDKVVLYNVDSPTYNPSDWLGINGSLLRVETLEDMRRDTTGLVILNTHSPTEIPWDTFVLENNLVLEKKVGNLLIYQFNKE